MKIETEIEDPEVAPLLDYLGEEVEADDALTITLGAHRGELIHRNDAVEHDGEVWPEDEDVSEIYVRSYDGYWIDRDDALWVTAGGHYGEWAYAEECTYWNDEVWVDGYEPDDIVWVEAEDDYAYAADVSCCETCDSYYLDSRGPCCASVDGDDHVNDYHCSPEPALHVRPGGYAVGFEVEKLTVNGCDGKGDYVGYRPLFSGWETDASCGVEGITNVYGFDPVNRALFFRDVADSEDHLAEPVDGTCGGHVNLSGPGLTLAKVRPYAGLIYALYRYRLTNTYANGDKALKEPHSPERYCAIRQKREGLVEFRLVSRVKNAGQLRWRYRLFGELSHCIEHELSFRGFIRRTRDLLREVYPDASERSKIRDLSFKFQRYLDEGVIHPDLAPFKLPAA